MNDFTMTNTPSDTNPSLVTLSAVSQEAKAMMTDYFGNVVSLPFTQVNAAIFSDTILRNGLSIGKTITIEQADELVADSMYEMMLDGDFEETEDGFVYGLEDGTALLVSFDGTMTHITE